MVLQDAQYAVSKKELPRYFCNRVGMKSGGLIPRSATAICDTFQDLLSDRKTPNERRFWGEPFRWANCFLDRKLNIIRFLKNSPDPTTVIQRFFVLSGTFIGCFVRTESGKEIYLSQTLRSWKICTRHKSMLEDSTEKRFECREIGDRAVFPQSKIDQLSWREKIRFFRKSTSNQGHLARGEEHNDVLQGEPDGSQPLNHQADGSDAPDDFWSFFCEIFFRGRLTE